MARNITENLPNNSAAMTLFRRVNMSRKQTRMPVLSALPVAYFVDGDTGLKQTTEAAWENKYLNAEELAAIIPIPESVLDDSDYNIWDELRPLMEEALGRAIDAAVFFGTNAPSTWPTNIVAAAIAAGNTFTRGTNATAALGLIAQDLSDLFALIEADGYDVNGLIANRTYRGRLRSVRDANGVRLEEVAPNSVYGVNVEYPLRGLWPTGAGAAEVIAGDFTRGIFAVRQDITYKVLDQAVIQDNTGTIQFNLAQQDMVALRVVMRVAWQIANPINRDQAVEASRYPFGVMVAP